MYCWIVAVESIFSLAHVPCLQLSTVTPSPSDIFFWKSSHSCCKSSIISGCSEPAGSSVALGFAFLPCSHTLEAWRRSRCPSFGSLTVSLTSLRRDGAFMQSISDQTGVMQLGFFVSARHCKAAVFAQEGVRDFWQDCCQHVHGFLVHSAVITKNEWNHPIIATRASVFENLALERVAYIC
ncbi:Hypothetical_protein [Hexamita inflata]|uniref:Hypothetical_protein n=1 Tax=Hexamita inflata TaxID=28002 RepID=A0AA86PKV7_9EUKA|nr:Hypothetical protein HINF_LOCUS29236 [Hexamita inflata]CAI9941594.1 Hypothetical protein HINF_LOCUS29239 [Hexamita inflata]